MENLLIQHVHVQDRRRMANVRFCGAQDLSDSMMEFYPSRASSSLGVVLSSGH